MDFSSWSPSHLIVAALVFATIIGQAIAVLARLKANTEQLQKQGETFVHALERLEDRVDKRLVEVNQRIDQVRTEIGDVRTGIGDVRSNMNQGFTDLRGEMNQRLSDMTGEISKMNQNHIDHLSHHQS